MTMTTSDHLSFWNQRYATAGEDYLFGVEPSRFMAMHASCFEAGSNALLVADGEGRNSVWLARQGLNVTALEIAPAALEKARRLATTHRVAVDFQQVDVLAYDWPSQQFDFVIGVFIQFVAPVERTRLFAGMQQAVKPSGLLMLHGYTPKQLHYGTGGPSAIENLYTADCLRQDFPEDAWEWIELREYDAVLNEGTAHCGTSALIDLIVRRRSS